MDIRRFVQIVHNTDGGIYHAACGKDDDGDDLSDVIPLLRQLQDFSDLLANIVLLLVLESIRP